MATVYIGSDHAGLELKAALVKRLSEKGHDVHDLGPATTESCDYPVYAKGVCGKVLADAGNATPGDEPASFGILVCGTGIGMSMTANHIPGIRAALCGCRISGPRHPPAQQRQRALPRRARDRPGRGPRHRRTVPEHRF